MFDLLVGDGDAGEVSDPADGVGIDGHGETLRALSTALLAL
jgi:hypothetical protein